MGLNCSRISRRSNSAPSLFHNTEGRRLFSNASTSPARERTELPSVQWNIVIPTSALRWHLNDTQSNINSTKHDIEHIQATLQKAAEGTTYQKIKDLNEQIRVKKEALGKIQPTIVQSSPQTNLPTIEEAVSQIKSLLEQKDTLTQEMKFWEPVVWLIKKRYPSDSDIPAEKELQKRQTSLQEITQAIENLHRIYPQEDLLKAQTLIDEIPALETQVKQLTEEITPINILSNIETHRSLKIRLEGLEKTKANYKELLKGRETQPK